MAEPPPPPAQDSQPDGQSDTRAESTNDRLCADLVQRWHRGERVPVEAYLRQHPRLESGERAFELILTEIILRQEYGEAAPLDEYVWRFPQFEDRLRRHFALHDGLAAAARQAAHQEQPSLSPGVSSGGVFSAGIIPESPAGLPDIPGFEIIARIGRGGMGMVYKARETSLDRFVAIKLLRDDQARAPDQLARFLREARTASALNHAGICTVHALNEHDGRPFIVMELIEGQTLRALVPRGLEPDEVARLIGQAALALAAAHAAGVVHRDIKPENIMARTDGQVKVVDFGLARLMPAGFPGNLPGELPGKNSKTSRPADDSGKESGSDSAMLAGTLSYMSPEQTRNEPLGSGSDIFSLGIVAYELATGRHPFAAGSVLGTFRAIATQQPIPPRQFAPALSNRLEALLLQMLEKDSRLRPTAAEIGAALGRETRTRTSPLEAKSPDVPRRTSVGREVERDALWSAYEAISQSRAQRRGLGTAMLLCVSGEPGIGKTTLVEDWLRGLRDSARVAGIGRGRCSERLAGTGSYLPVLEALEGLLKGEAGSLAARLMPEFAGTWYAQVAVNPGDSSIELLDGPGGPFATATQEQMKREFLSFVTEVGRRVPLILFFDDVQWADASTVDLIAWLGRRAAELRLLIVATYRPAEMHSGKNPFAAVQLELERHGVCRELPLAFLTHRDVARYLDLRYPRHQFPADFATRLYDKTEGNPLFLAELVRHLHDRGVIASRDGCWKLAESMPDFENDLPVSVRSLIRGQIEQLDAADRQLLSVGSVQGNEFDAAVAAGVLGQNVADVEERLERLDRVRGLVQLVREQEFPDGTLTLRYRFVHVLYQNALYSAVTPGRRAEWSAQVAAALLAHHGNQNATVASEAAMLFEKARDWARAAECFYLAARNPLRLHAPYEAAVLARCGLEMLARLPETPERARQEVRLQFALGLALQPSEGFAAPAVVEAYRRARALSHVEIEPVSRSPLLWGLWSFYILRGEHHAAREIANELQDLAQGQTDPLVSLAADHSTGYSLMMLGRPAEAWLHLGRNLPAETQAVYGRDIGIPFRAHGSVVLWLLGFPDQAVERSRLAARRAREKLDFYGLSIALFNAAKIHQLRREPNAAAEYAQALLSLTQEQAFPVWMAAGTVLAGWAEARLGEFTSGAARIRQGIASYLANGAAMMQPYFLGLLAEALDAGGQADQGLTVLDGALALVEQTGEQYYKAELLRLRGELLLKAGGQIDRTDEAHACFQQALAVARGQGALLLELRTMISAAHFARRQGGGDRNRAAVRSILAPICDRFTEGFETFDWRAAAAMCHESD